MARRESGFHVDKKGTIDLVTEVDLECERMCRAILAERFPDHDILAEELSTDARAAERVHVPLGLRSARRHHQLRARAADLLLVAGAGDRRPRRRSARSTTRRAPSCSPPSAGRGVPQRTTAADVHGRRVDRRAARHRLSLRRPQADRRSGDDVRGVPRSGARRPAAGIGGARLVLRRRGPLRRLLGAAPLAVGRGGRRADRDRGRRRGHRNGRHRRSTRPPRIWSPRTVESTDAMLDVIAEVRQRSPNRTN